MKHAWIQWADIGSMGQAWGYGIGMELWDRQERWARYIVGSGTYMLSWHGNVGIE